MQSLPAPPPEVGHPGLKAVADRFAPATLKMRDALRLLRRRDTKFLLPADQVMWVLAGLAKHYEVLQVCGTRIARYRTIYFDTPELECFHQHRRGRRPRHKVRIRQYLDTGRAYFEIKSKGQNNQTNKLRIPQPFGDVGLGDDARQLIEDETSLPADLFHPSTIIDFKRLSLLSPYESERFTVDVDIDFVGARPDRNLQDVSVVEVKQAPFRRESPIMSALRAHGFRPRPMSKYCASLALALRALPRHHVRRALRAVERTQNE